MAAIIEDYSDNYFDSLVSCDDILQGDWYIPSDDQSETPNCEESSAVGKLWDLPKRTSSYLSSLLANTLKSNQVEINTDSKSLKPVARLKEPRDLFTLPKEPDCAQEAARWPAECQVVDVKIQHIEVMPCNPEVYYSSSGKEIVVKVIGDDAGHIVYQYNPMSAVNYFTRSVSGGNRIPPSFLANGDLKFESRFESGNLAKAVKITETYYELSIRSDLYTNKHMQWFYFMIENTKRGVLYRFSIVNLLKGDSLYNEGMRPVMYSCKDAVVRKIGWRRCGTNINYYQNDQNGEDDQNSTYTLTFNLEFPYDDDCVFLAHNYPYTYSDLQEYLIKLQNHPVKSSYTKLRLLCKSLAGNNVYYLTVTDPTEDENNPRPRKKAVVMTARVHPGESPASWIMKGVIDFITGDSAQAKELREKFIFKLIPMLNPDGVIVGNNRCSLSGRDLNRQYRTVIRETYPPVWHTKLMIKRLIEECGVAMYCDLHAHSRKHNVFIYGCENKRIAEKRLQEQVFPLMLHKNSADKFSFENCKFRINKDKEGTGRVVIWMMGVDNSYTLEASFAGSTLGSRHHTHFSTTDYENMGKSFCETLLDYVDETPGKLRLRSKIVFKLLKEGSSADEPANIELSDYSSDEGELSDFSDDEKRKREEYTLTAPPPSPVLPGDRKNIQKESPKSHKHPPPVIVYSPPAQRKIMQIPTAKLDLDSPDGPSSGDELLPRSTPKRIVEVKSSEAQSAASYSKGERPSMPPELIVTSTQGQGSGDLSVFERLYKSAEISRGHLSISKPASRRGSYKKTSPERPRRKLVRQNGEHSDPEGRSPSEVKLPLKQQFWKVLSNDNLPWSYCKDEHEQILKACSQRLAELKRKHKTKTKEKLEIDAAKVTMKKKIKRRSKSMRVEKTSSLYNVEHPIPSIDSIKVKALRPLEIKKLPEDDILGRKSYKKPQQNRKFRKGGIVSLATVNPNIAQDHGSGDESVENSSMKKKKKKRKILQLPKAVKTAVNAVSAVTISSVKRDVKKDASKKKLIT